jgi:hypothetical protein
MLLTQLMRLPWRQQPLHLLLQQLRLSQALYPRTKRHGHPLWLGSILASEVKFLSSSFFAKANATSLSSNASIPYPQVELFDSDGDNLNQTSIMQTRSKIRQQLRFLFVYPLAYMAMWLLPFISHALQYGDYYAANPPYVLAVLVTVITVSQSALDCWIFNIKERPWR